MAGAVIGALKARLEVDGSKFDAGMSRAGGKLDKLAGRMGGIGKAMTAGVTAPLALLATGAFKSASTFDEAMSVIQGGTGASGEALADLKDSFKVVFAGVPESADVVAGALADLNTITGATGSVLESLTKNVLDAGRVLGDESVSAAEFGRALKQFEIPAKDGSAALDALFTISQNTGIGLGKLIDSTTTYGGVLKNAGFTMEETAGLFGQLDSAGISVSRVMPGLNKSFRTWAAEGHNVRDMLSQTVDKMKNATSDTEALTIATAAFGAEGAQRMTTAVRSGVLALDDLTAGLAGSEGAVATAAEETKTFSQKMAELGNKVMTALEPLGGPMLKAVEDLIPLVIKGVEWLSKFATWFGKLSPKAQKVGLVIGGVAAALGPLLAMFAPMIPMIGSLVGAAGGLSGILAGLGTAFTVLTGPIGLTVAAIVGLGVIWVKWGDDIKRVVVATVTAIKDWLGNKFGAIVDGVKDKIAAVGNFFKDLKDKVVGNSYIPDMVTGIGKSIATLDSTFVKKIETQTSRAEQAFRDMWTQVSELSFVLGDRGLAEEAKVLEAAFVNLTQEERENELVMQRVGAAARELIARGAQLSGTLTVLAQSAGIATLSMDQMYGGLQLIEPTMDDVGGEATGFFGRLVSGFKGLFGQTDSGATTWLGGLGDKFKSLFGQTESGTQGWVGGLGDKFKGLFTQTESGTTNWVGSMAGLFGGLFGGPGGVGGSIASIIEGGMAMALNALVPGLGALAGVAMQGLKKIGGMFKSAFGKIGGWIKGMFGGPGKKEMGGRRASDDFKAMTNEMISDAGRAKVEMMVQNEGWHRDLAIQVVAVGEKYKELGLTQQEANRDVKATWDAIKRGPNAVNRAVQLIIDKMNGVTKVAQDATAAIDLTFAERTIGIGFDIDTQAIRDALARIPTIIAGLPSGTIPALAQGGIVTRPTLALVGEAGPEAVVPLSGGGGGLGGMSMDAVVERLDRLDRTLYQQPRVMARALAAALQMGVA